MKKESQKVLDYLKNVFNDYEKTENELNATNQQLTANEQQLRAANQQLGANNQQLITSEQEIKKHSHDLGERIKELGCFYEISETVRKRETIKEILQDITKVIPPAWQYPEITCAKISFGNMEYKTDNYEDSKWKLSSDIVVKRKIAGKIEVCYLEQKSHNDVDPFLKEERILLDNITERLGRIIERKNAEEELKTTNQQLDASNQQLKAFNQQLNANNQQLSATEQQLRASNQQLTASEKDLKKEKEFSENLLITANAFILTLDLNANITLFNKFAEKLTGYKKEEVLGKNWFNLFIPKQNGTIIPEVFANVLKDMPEVSSYENPVLCRNGSERLIHWENTVLKNENGEISGIISIGTDITERKQAEKKLEESEIRFRELFENMSNGVAVYEAVNDGNDFIFKDFNKTGERMDKIQRNELIDQSVLKVFPGVKEFGLFDVFQRVWKTGKSEHLPVSLYKDNKIQGWRENYVYKLPSGEIVAIYEDITERKQAEQALLKSEKKLSSFMNAATDGFTILDENLVVRYANPAGLKMLGMKQEDIVGMSVLDINPDLKKSGRHDAYLKVIETGKPFSAEDITIHPKFGDLHFSVRAFKVGEGLGVTVENITERKQAEEEIKAKNIFLEGLIQQSPLPTFVMDSKGFVLIVNEAFLKLYAAPNKEMILGKNALTEPANVKQDVVKYFREALSGKIVEIPEIEFISPYKNKKVITRGRLFPILDPTGKLTNVVVIQEDVTKRKQAEEALKVSEERFSSVFSNISNIAVQGYDKNRKVTYWNKASETLYGYSQKEAINKKLEDLIIPHEMRETVISLIDNWHDNNIKIPNSELLLMKKDKSPVAVFSSHVMIEKSNGEKEMFCIDTDITGRKKAEEKMLKTQYYLSKAQEIGKVGSWELDIQSSKLKWTDETYKMFNIPIGTKMTHELFMGCVHPDDRNFLNTSFNNALQKVKPFDIEHRIIVNNNIKWLNEKADIKFDAKGNPVIANGFVQDITERKQAEELLKKRMNELEIFNDAAVNRELKINEHRKEINELLEKMGEKAKYEIIV